jgi:2'-5' RNA ligase
MRMFYALNLPEEVKNRLYREARSWDMFKIVRSDNYHITLAFLGDVSEDKKETLVEIGKKIAEKQPEPEIKFQLNLLTTKRDMLWAVPDQTPKTLLSLRDNLVNTLAEQGFTEPTALPFLPHVKLGFTDSVGKKPLSPEINLLASGFTLYATEFVSGRGVKYHQIQNFQFPTSNV